MILMAGVWVVYKFQHFIFRKHPEEKEEVGRYKTKEEAYVKTRQMLKNDFPNRHDMAEKSEHEDELGTFWMIEFFNTIVTFIFIPYKIDDNQ